MKREPSSANDFDVDAHMEALLREYLKHTGKRIPETAEEIAVVLHIIERDGLEAPERLRNCDIFARAALANVYKCSPISNTTRSDAVQHLRRAARDGKAISPKTEAQMQADRAKAKRESHGEK